MEASLCLNFDFTPCIKTGWNSSVMTNVYLFPSSAL